MTTAATKRPLPTDGVSEQTVDSSTSTGQAAKRQRAETNTSSTPSVHRSAGDSLPNMVPIFATGPQPGFAQPVPYPPVPPHPYANEALRNMLCNMMNYLDHTTCRDLLVFLGERDPHALQAIQGQYHRIQAAEMERRRVEQERTIDFDHHSKSAWHIINTKYTSMSGSAQYDVAFDAVEELEDIMASIKNQVVAESNYGTKKSAFETLRKIGKSIAVSTGDVVAHEVRKKFQYNPALTDAMYSVLDSLNDEEARMLRETNDGELLGKMEELAEEARGYCIFEEIDGVLDLFKGSLPVDGQGEDSNTESTSE